jgi:uncharacterized membrane protein
MNTQSPTAVRVYLARVRSALTDLPPAEVEEILEDVRPHMTEIVVELGEGARIEALIEQLGTPEAYAAELRAAGDYPPASEAPAVPAAEAKQRRLPARLALWGLVLGALGVGLVGLTVGLELSASVMVTFVILVPVLALSAWYVYSGGARSVAGLPEVRKVRSSMSSFVSDEGNKTVAYLRTLQPAWWVLCAAVLLLLGLFVVLSRGHEILALPLFLAAAAAILWLGPKAKSDRRLLWLSLPISAFVVGAALGLVGYGLNRVDNSAYYGSTAYSANPNQGSDGKPALYYGSNGVDNVYAFDAQGRPLTDIFLYDETGRPLTLPRYACEPRTGSRLKIGEDNRYPRPNIDQGAVDNYGVYNGYNADRAACREDTGVPFSAAIPKGMQPSTAPAPSSPTPTPPTSSSAPESPAKPTG